MGVDGGVVPETPTLIVQLEPPAVTVNKAESAFNGLPLAFKLIVCKPVVVNVPVPEKENPFAVLVEII